MRIIHEKFFTVQFFFCFRRLKTDFISSERYSEAVELRRQGLIVLMNMGFTLKEKHICHEENEFQHRLLTDRMNIHRM